MIIFKNLFSFVLTFFAYDWIIDGGIRRTLIAISSVQVVICLLSIPMCKYTSAAVTLPVLTLLFQTYTGSEYEPIIISTIFSLQPVFDETST